MLKNAIRIPGRTDPQEYHRPQEFKRGDPRRVISSSALKEFGACPEKWLTTTEEKESDALSFGSLQDMRLLTPELFDKYYCVTPEFYPANARSTEVVEGRCNVGDDLPWNGAAAYCKNWKKEQDENLTVVSTDEVREVDKANARIMAKPIMKSFIESSEKQVQCVAEWHDEATGLVIPLKILLDLVPSNESIWFKSLGDLKTTRNAGLIPFQMDAFKLGYQVSASLYMDIYKLAHPDEDRCNWAWLLVENVHPYQPAKRVMTQALYETGQAQYRQMLANYCQCLKYDHWPDFDETDEAIGDNWGLCDITPFMAERALFAPRYSFGPKTEAPEQDPDNIP